MVLYYMSLNFCITCEEGVAMWTLGHLRRLQSIDNDTINGAHVRTIYSIVYSIIYSILPPPLWLHETLSLSVFPETFVSHISSHMEDNHM